MIPSEASVSASSFSRLRGRQLLQKRENHIWYLTGVIHNALGRGYPVLPARSWSAAYSSAKIVHRVASLQHSWTIHKTFFSAFSGCVGVSALRMQLSPFASNENGF